MSPRFRRLVVLVAIALFGAAHTLPAQTATATTLSILSGGAPVTSVPAGTVITMSAAVSGGSLPITGGTVYFCDSIVKNCMLMPIATAQVVNGTATFKTVLAPSAYSVTAVYVPATGFSTSTSPASTFSINGSSPTTSSLTSSGDNGGTHTVDVSVLAQTPITPTGTITINDTTAGTVLASETLSPGLAATTIALNQASQQAGDSRGACTTVTGDFNGDGHPDIAIGSGCKASDGLTSATALQILLNNGDGTFTAGPPVPAAMTNTNVTGLTVGDFNNDGILDIIAASSDNTGPHTYLLANDGTGTFTASQLSTTCSSSQLVTADFNRDGNLDFVSTCGIFLGTGTGSFSQNQTNIPYLTGAPQNMFAVADFNKDGYPDIAGFTSDGNYTVDMFTNSGNGKDFTATPLMVVRFPLGVLAGDFDGDGTPDLFVFGQTFDASYNISGAAIYIGGQPTTQIPAPSSTSGTSISTGDFNHDGITDFAFVTYGSISVVLGSSNSPNWVAGSIPLTNTQPSNTFPSVVADFDGDGIPDILASSSDQSNSTLYTVGGSSRSYLSNTTINIVGSGSHAVSANYSGDSMYASNTSNTLNLSAGLVATSLSLTASPNPSSIGTQVALTATLTPYSTGSLTTNGDIITFYNGSTVLGTATLNNGIAVLNLTNQPVGSISVTARFPGDANFSLAGTSTSVTVTPIPAPTISQTAIDFGSIDYTTSAMHSVMLTNTATGPLTIASIQASSGFTQTNDCGNSLASATHCTITVTFAPTSPIATTGSLTITINAVTPTTTVALSGTGIVYPTVQLTASPNTAAIGTPVTFTATVTPASVGSATANGGYVSFSSGSATFTPVLVANGKATLTTQNLPVGANVVSASFSGGSNYAGANSNNVTVTVTDIAMPSASPTSIPFGTVGIGSSISQNVTITNTDTVSPLAIASVQISSGFSLVNHCGASLAPLASCTATVTFTPTAATTTNGTLTFTTNANTSTLTVNLSGTGVAPTLSLVASPTSAPVAAAVTLTATLAPYSAGNLTTNGKTITFTKGGTTLGTGTLNNGVATLSLTNLPLGSNSIAATFTGDADFAAVSSSAATVSITAPPAPTISPTTISFGTLRLNTPTTQTVSLTNTSTGPLTIASIVASSGFTQTNTCGSSVAAGASCAITVSFTATSATAAAGTLAITTNASVPITTIALSGSGIASALYLTASPASVSLGTQVALSATLAPYTNGDISTNGKSVTFTSGGSVLGTATLNNGTAVFNTSTLPVGNSTITATFTGDANFTSATSNSTTVTVAGLATTLHLAASPTSASLGNQVALTATLTPYSAGSLTTNGKTITFTKGSTSLGTATLNNGTAVLNLTNLPLGSNSITASFTGDTNFASASSSATTVTITGPTAPTVTPTSVNFGAITLGNSVSQTVTLTNIAASPLTISAVTISDGFTQTNTCGVLAVSASCTATVTFAPTAANTYNGTLTFTTNAVTPTTTVALSGSGVASVTASAGGSSNLGTIKSGSTGSLPITFAIAPGVSGTLTTSCSVKLTNGGTATTPPTCSTSPSTFTVTGGNTINTTLTITTTGSTAALRMPTSGIALAGGLIGLLAFLRRKPTFASLLLLLLSLTAIGSITGCGTSGGGSSSNSGGGSSSNGGGSATNSTTPGTYTVTVTGTIGTQTSSVNLPLTIQ